MSTKITSWQIVGGKLEPIDTTLAEHGKTEPYDLESWIASNPSLIGPEIRIIGRQVHTHSGPLDLLAIDRAGNLVIIELKRDQLPRGALMQAIDYASDVANWSIERLGEVCLQHTDKTLEDLISEEFPEESLENLSINETQRIILIGFSIEAALERMIQWLSDTYDVSINAILLHYARTSGGDEIISRTTIIDEKIAERHARGKSIKIEMSDEPAELDDQDLRQQLTQYLSKKMVTPKRIRDYLLPLALQNEIVTREQLKTELENRGEAADSFQAGIQVTSVSTQLGLKKNGFLRQVIAYDYPKNLWEKDNYRIREGQRDLVAEVLAGFSGDTEEEGTEV